MKDVSAKVRRKARFIIELRYKPIPEFIDIRGRALGALLPHIESVFKHWQAKDDHILFLDDPARPLAEFFLGTQRLSVITEDAASLQSFLDQAVKWLGLAHDQLGKQLNVLDRLGVRFVTIASTTDNDYSGVKQRILDRFHRFPVDLPLDYSDSQVVLIHKYGRYAVGPTQESDEWIQRSFKSPQSHVPAFGIALDVDSFAKGIKITSRGELERAVYGTLSLTTSVEEAVLRGAGALDG